MNAAYRSLTDSEGVGSRELCENEGVGSRVKGEHVAPCAVCAASCQLDAYSRRGNGGDGGSDGDDAGARLRVARTWCVASMKVARHLEIESSAPGDRLLAPGVRTLVFCGIVFWCFV